ncbi:MAG: isocitrate/isopropylmalate dehydrogenase family protein [Bacilli bacterium]|nr:isocitrate/isopropylmalate dehydrogenase family protein [Bacilli bacterium]
MAYDVVLLKGDGIGPEIADSVVEVIKSAGVDISYHSYDVGMTSLEKNGTLLSEETIEAIKKYKVALKGPITTPIGKGFKSINVQLRTIFNLFANVRPAKSYPGYSRYTDVDIVTVRENLEDLYIGEEHEIENGWEAIKRITVEKSTRIIRYAFEYALKNGRKKVTCVHKANILKNSDGLFLKLFNEIKNDYPSIISNDKIVDNMCMQLVMNPEQFDVIVAPNLYGDILSDLIAGLTGGLGLAPAANIGEGVSIFEAVHGSAPDIAGKGIADSIALLRSACLMLDHLGEKPSADRIRSAIDRTLLTKDGLTPDLGGDGNLSTLTKKIISNL